MLANELEIYEDTYQFVSLVLDCTKNFESDYKQTLKDRLVNKALDLFKYIQIANRFQDTRFKSLTAYLVVLEECKMLLRLAYDKKQISSGQQEALLEKLIKISRQATSWKNK